MQESTELCLHVNYQNSRQVGSRLLVLETNEFIITSNSTFELTSELLVKDKRRRDTRIYMLHRVSHLQVCQ